MLTNVLTEWKGTACVKVIDETIQGFSGKCYLAFLETTTDEDGKSTVVVVWYFLESGMEEPKKCSDVPEWVTDDEASVQKMLEAAVDASAWGQWYRFDDGTAARELVAPELAQKTVRVFCDEDGNWWGIYLDRADGPVRVPISPLKLPGGDAAGTAPDDAKDMTCLQRVGTRWGAWHRFRQGPLREVLHEDGDLLHRCFVDAAEKSYVQDMRREPHPGEPLPVEDGTFSLPEEAVGEPTAYASGGKGTWGRWIKVDGVYYREALHPDFLGLGTTYLVDSAYRWYALDSEGVLALVEIPPYEMMGALNAALTSGKTGTVLSTDTGTWTVGPLYEQDGRWMRQVTDAKGKRTLYVRDRDENGEIRWFRANPVAKYRLIPTTAPQVDMPEGAFVEPAYDSTAYWLEWVRIQGRYYCPAVPPGRPIAGVVYYRGNDAKWYMRVDEGLMQEIAPLDWMTDELLAVLPALPPEENESTYVWGVHWYRWYGLWVTDMLEPRPRSAEERYRQDVYGQLRKSDGSVVASLPGYRPLGALLPLVDEDELDEDDEGVMAVLLRWAQAHCTVLPDLFKEAGEGQRSYDYLLTVRGEDDSLTQHAYREDLVTLTSSMVRVDEADLTGETCVLLQKAADELYGKILNYVDLKLSEKAVDALQVSSTGNVLLTSELGNLAGHELYGLSGSYAWSAGSPPAFWGRRTRLRVRRVLGTAPERVVCLDLLWTGGVHVSADTPVTRGAITSAG